MTEAAEAIRTVIRDHANTEHELLTLKEALPLLRVSKNTAYEQIRQGLIPSRRIGRKIFIPRRALERFLEQASAVAQ